VPGTTCAEKTIQDGDGQFIWSYGCDTVKVVVTKISEGRHVIAFRGSVWDSRTTVERESSWGKNLRFGSAKLSDHFPQAGGELRVLTRVLISPLIPKLIRNELRGWSHTLGEVKVWWNPRDHWPYKVYLYTFRSPRERVS
jgi:hypothetical protein